MFQRWVRPEEWKTDGSSLIVRASPLASTGVAGMSTSAQAFARIGVGWAGSYVMTRAFARWLPGQPLVALLADVNNRMDLVASGELDLLWRFPLARVECAYLGHRACTAS